MRSANWSVVFSVDLGLRGVADPSGPAELGEDREGFGVSRPSAILRCSQSEAAISVLGVHGLPREISLNSAYSSSRWTRNRCWATTPAIRCAHSSNSSP